MASTKPKKYRGYKIVGQNNGQNIPKTVVEQPKGNNEAKEFLAFCKWIREGNV